MLVVGDRAVGVCVVIHGVLAVLVAALVGLVVSAIAVPAAVVIGPLLLDLFSHVAYFPSGSSFLFVADGAVCLCDVVPRSRKGACAGVEVVFLARRLFSVLLILSLLLLCWCPSSFCRVR